MSFGKSFMEKNIVTAIKENVDPEKLERNMTLTKTKTPAELAQINSLSEFPVPEKIKNILNQSGSKVEKESKKRIHSAKVKLYQDRIRRIRYNLVAFKINKSPQEGLNLDEFEIH